ncbi:MAG: hypothetical protein R2867_32835 [Caldilineaceae bacterium]
MRCVVLNACSSAQQAEAIAGVVDAVVGMGDVVSDNAALAFATAFYRALMSDATLATAMTRARNQIDLTGLAEVDTPQLRADRIDAEQVRRAIGTCQPPQSQLEVPKRSTPVAAAILAVGSRPVVILLGGITSGNSISTITARHHLQQAPHNLPCPAASSASTPSTNISSAATMNWRRYINFCKANPTSVSAPPSPAWVGWARRNWPHYARAHIADYPDGIFWITAADLNNIRPQLADFCVALNLPVADPQRTGDLTEQKISAFKAYLDAHPKPCSSLTTWKNRTTCVPDRSALASPR